MFYGLNSPHSNRLLYPADSKGKEELTDVVAKKVERSMRKGLRVLSPHSASLEDVMIEVEVLNVSVNPDRRAQLEKLAGKEVKQLLDESIDRLQNQWDLDAYITFFSIESWKKNRVDRRDLLFALERYERLKNGADKDFTKLELLFASEPDFGAIVNELDRLEGKHWNWKVIGGVVLALALLVGACLLIYNFAAVKHAVNGGPKSPIDPHRPPIHPINPPAQHPGSGHGFGLHHGIWGWNRPSVTPS